MASVYVSTYAKYNNGNLAGAWLDITAMDEDDYTEAIKDLHKDEEDPEFMIQDYEGFPKEFYSESGLDDRVWEYLALDDDDQQKVSAFLDCFGDCTGDVFEAAESAYYGKYDSDYDFAVELLENTGDMQGIPPHLQFYFDYDKYARDLMYDYSSSNDYYFSNNW